MPGICVVRAGDVDEEASRLYRGVEAQSLSRTIPF